MKTLKCFNVSHVFVPNYVEPAPETLFGKKTTQNVEKVEKVKVFHRISMKANDSVENVKVFNDSQVKTNETVENVYVIQYGSGFQKGL